MSNRPSDHFTDTGRSHPDARDDVPPEDEPRGPYLTEEGEYVTPGIPELPPAEEPEPEQAPTWQDVPEQYREHLASAVEAHNARRRQLGLSPATVEWFEDAFNDGGPDAFNTEVDRLIDSHEDLGRRIEAGEKRPLTPEEEALREATTGIRRGEFDVTKNDEYRLNAAAERGDVWAELERQGAIAPRESWGGPDGRDQGHYGDEQPPHSPRQ